jgi:1,4-dihydroxy-2-naphthoyl-CoA hydrolase
MSRDPEDPGVSARAVEQPPFADFLGMTVTHVSRERVTAELVVREELGNRFGILHGGAIMALADNLGGTATIANLPDEQTTTTIESKTNFFAGIPVGDTAHAECTPLHRGRTTMVWQTRVTRGDGKLAAIVTQTQMVLTRKG